MDTAIHVIPLGRLALTFIPIGVVILIMFRWSLDATGGLIAVARMLVQLTLIGFLLTWIFEGDSPGVVLALLSIMLLVASWISMRPVDQSSWSGFAYALLAIALPGCLTLVLVTTTVLQVEPWYAPRQVIPLAGMIFASSMNAVSISAERYQSEICRGAAADDARREAFRASLIPLLNSLLAVGLVSLPGMMTGQILSGISPLLAVRYQIMVMCMLTGASGMAAALYLSLAHAGAQK